MILWRQQEQESDNIAAFRTRMDIMIKTYWSGTITGLQREHVVEWIVDWVVIGSVLIKYIMQQVPAVPAQLQRQPMIICEAVTVIENHIHTEDTE